MQKIPEVDGDNGSGQVENTANDNDDDNNEILTSPVEGDVDQVLQNLTQLVIALPVTSPPVQPAQPSLRTQTRTSQQPPPLQSSSQRKPPHCSTCGHTLQGHKRLVLMEASGKSCPVCPSQICSREGRPTSCACHWCTRQPPTIPANRALSSLSQVPCVVRETHINQDVTEWLISDSQSSVTHNQMGSNACSYHFIVYSKYTYYVIKVYCKKYTKSIFLVGIKLVLSILEVYL